MQLRNIACVFVLSCFIAACPDDGDSGATDVADIAEVIASDVLAETTDLELDIQSDADDVADDHVADGQPDVSQDSDVADADGDVQEPEPELAVGPPFEPPVDPLAGSDVQGCTIYLETDCMGSVTHTCQLYDTTTGTFVAEVDPLLRRVLLYERWYELYHSPDRQTAERRFNQETLAGLSEEEWSSLDRFSAYNGAGDSAIWTGAALNAFILRYLETGTEADYERMEDKVRALITDFEVTGIPGYLARYHFLLMQPGAPITDEHIFRYDETLDHLYRPIDAPETIEGLPDVYFDGFEDSGGTVHMGVPWWRGNPSIDQYTGPMVTFPAAYGLLEDEELQGDIAHHLTCYLKRLRRIEIINLQDAPDVIEALEGVLAGGQLNLDPDDIDFHELDTIVLYVNNQINTLNEADFDRTCPDTIDLIDEDPIDATSPDFIIRALELVADLQGHDNERYYGIDHFYVPSVRGGDAMHLMHLAAMAYYFTEDEMYRNFLFDELIGNIRTIEVAYTMGAFIPSRWCRSYYGEHITFSPLWAFINLLDDSEVRDAMMDVMRVEMWLKEMIDLENAKFNLMYAGALPHEIAVDWQTVRTDALDLLDGLGGNGGVFEDPRRTYSVSYDDVVDNLPAGIVPICPSEEERATCEQAIEIFGFEYPGESISFECRGDQNECVMEDGMCTRQMASWGLPVQLRPYADFIWQRNPFQIGARSSPEGVKQSPGLDLVEAYWLARHYGFIDEGEGQVLAWQPGESCEE